jgi:hypothetical protein
MKNSVKKLKNAYVKQKTCLSPKDELFFAAQAFEKF